MAFTFKEKILDANPKNTMVVDALNLAFRWKHQGRNDFRYDFLQTVQSLAISYKSKKIIITADWGSSTYRKALDPEYKADRKEKFKDQTEQEKIAFEEFFDEYESTLKLLSEHYTVLRYKGVEADDIAAHLVRYKEQYEFENIWLISSDRDWDLLIADDVSRFSYVTRKETTMENWFEHYDVEPEKYISLKCLQGDKGDNVPGIPQIGPKRASGLLEQYDSAMDIYDAIPLEGKYVYIKNLNDSGDRILLNYELMDLMTYCDDAIGEDNVNDIRKTLGWL